MDVLVNGAIIGAAALTWCYRYATSPERMKAILNSRPNEKPLRMGRTYYRMPDGSIRSRKREYRKLLMESKGVTSGRQWVRIRKALPHALRLFV